MYTKLAESGVAATFGRPDGEGPFPAVVALGGSDGGTPEYFLNLLVPEGFAVLALVYWGTPETQPTLSDVPLERVERGLRWLREQPNDGICNESCSVRLWPDSQQVRLKADATYGRRRVQADSSGHGTLSCTNGQRLSPYEQNTQQSPAFGLRMDRQLGHS